MSIRKSGAERVGGMKVAEANRISASTTSGPSRVGKRGTVTIPAALRRRYGIEEGSLVVAEAREVGVLIRRAETAPIGIYTPDRKADFILSSTVDAADYAAMTGAVRAMGLNPDAIPHYKPPGA